MNWKFWETDDRADHRALEIELQNEMDSWLK